MNCDETRRHWHERLDGAHRDAGLEEHLRGCATCRRYVSEMNSIAESLEGLRRDTEAIVSTATHVAAPWPPGRTLIQTTWFRRASGIAAAIAVAIAAWAYLRSATPPRIPTGPMTHVDDADATPLGITLRGQSARQFLAVADATSDANVQVFHLYPVLAGAEPATSP